MIRRPPRSTLFPTRRSSDLLPRGHRLRAGGEWNGGAGEPVGGRALRRGRSPYSRAQRSEERRSEEHTSELQSPCNLVCRLLLEKKKAKRWSVTPSTGQSTRS